MSHFIRTMYPVPGSHLVKKLIKYFYLLLVCVACTKQDGIYSTHSKPERVADYLYEITYTDYKAIAGERYARTLNSASHGAACTVVRNGNLVGRNYDYLYSDMAEFVIHVPAAEGRYASIGIASSIFELTPNVVESDPYGQYFDFLPFVTVDGMNEKGVYCCINMVHGEFGYQTIGTNPGSSATLYASFPVRYVLDNCATAAEACRALDTANIVFLEALGEFHFFIADRTESWVVEVFDNKLRYRKWNDNVLTNFYVLTDGFIADRSFDAEPEGVERYDYAREHIDEFKTPDAAAKLMSDLRYSKRYDLSNNPFWYSEYYGKECNAGTIDRFMPKENYADFIKEECEAFKNAKRDYLQGFWITTHTSVYDLENLTLRVYSQENYGEYYDFSLR